MIKDITIRSIDYGSLAYDKTLLLRDAVLRKPLGLCLFDEDLTAESADTHIAALLGEEPVGVMILTRVDDQTVRMRQVAVQETYQGLGIGTQMVVFAEAKAKNLGYHRIVLHARKTAVPFYIKAGYDIKGEAYLEVGIPHYSMEKTI